MSTTIQINYYKHRFCKIAFSCIIIIIITLKNYNKLKKQYY